MVTSFPAQPAQFPYLSNAHWKIPIWENPSASREFIDPVQTFK